MSYEELDAVAARLRSVKEYLSIPGFESIDSGSPNLDSAWEEFRTALTTEVTDFQKAIATQATNIVNCKDQYQNVDSE